MAKSPRKEPMIRLGDNTRALLPGPEEIEREPDDVLLKGSAFGPDHDAKKKAHLLFLIHEKLIEVLVRMSEKDSEKFGRFIDMLNSLEFEEMERIYKGVKIYGFVRWLSGGVIWLISFFIAGIALAATVGDQINKVFGYIHFLSKFLKIT